MRDEQLSEATLPGWARWTPSPQYSVGIEEEVMLLDPTDWSLAQRMESILPALPPTLLSRVSAETHAAAVELHSEPHEGADGAAHELAGARAALERALLPCGLRVASAGTHPFAVWTEIEVSRGARYRLVYESMRELARREPTFALHVHIGVADAPNAIALYNRLRTHVPILLALSANSPFWQGRDTGLASARTPIFQAFPRVGIPRPFSSYADYAAAVDLLLRCEAFPEPTFLWWDVRPQPRFGTVEVRAMDAQTNLAHTRGLAALVQAIAHLELEEGYHHEQLIESVEILDENRFLAARDGMDAILLDPVSIRRVPARTIVQQLLGAARPHAQQLGCEDALEMVSELALKTGADRQRELARTHPLPALVQSLSEQFTAPAHSHR